MSHQHTATLGAAPTAIATRRATSVKPSIWRRLFDAWLLAYASRGAADAGIVRGM